jgi:hypothetical protein
MDCIGVPFNLSRLERACVVERSRLAMVRTSGSFSSGLFPPVWREDWVRCC